VGTFYDEILPPGRCAVRSNYFSRIAEFSRHGSIYYALRAKSVMPGHVCMAEQLRQGARDARPLSRPPVSRLVRLAKGLRDFIANIINFGDAHDLRRSADCDGNQPARACLDGLLRL